MLTELSNKYNIILGSKSPRRKELLKEIIPEFNTQTKDIKENYPPALTGDEIAIYLSSLKSKAFTLAKNDLLLTSDTIVILDNKVLGKPESTKEAIHMLTSLSGKTHQVITGVTIRTKKKYISFSDTTEVEFYPLTKEEIEFYVTNYKPLDKAGSYGIQEWIGYIGIKKMNGDFYNVMGLPVHKLYRELNNFL